METNKNIDWEQRRYEIAKEMFARYAEFRTRDADAKQAVDFADALIEELQKPKKPKKQDKFSRIVELVPEMYKALNTISKLADPKNRSNNIAWYLDMILSKISSVAMQVLVNYPEIEE